MESPYWFLKFNHSSSDMSEEVFPVELNWDFSKEPTGSVGWGNWTKVWLVTAAVHHFQEHRSDLVLLAPYTPSFPIEPWDETVAHFILARIWIIDWVYVSFQTVMQDAWARCCCLHICSLLCFLCRHQKQQSSFDKTRCVVLFFIFSFPELLASEAWPGSSRLKWGIVWMESWSWSKMVLIGDWPDSID